VVGGTEDRRAYYLERIKAAEEAASSATDQKTIDGWKTVTEVYRQLLSGLPADPSTEPEAGAGTR
jgi:hypothetical protein